MDMPANPPRVPSAPQAADPAGPAPVTTIDQFLSMLSHDLRNPLNAITVSAGYLKRFGHLAEDQAQVVDRINGSARRMARMISELVDYGRCSLGHGLTLHRESADLATICRRALDGLGPDAARIAVTVPAEARGEWDAERLSQAVATLADNALHHGADPITLQVAVEGDAVRLELRNANRDGPIPEEMLARLFEGPDRARRQGPAGMGLGLYLAGEIARAHGGRLEARSGAEGTAFTLTLPRAPS